MEYVPYDQRPPSTEYRRVLQRILDSGIEIPTRQDVNALTVMNQSMSFPLALGFPMITERNIGSSWYEPISELCAFINGATSLERLAEFGCDWWKPWAMTEKAIKKRIESRSLGPTSYGGAFHDFPTAEGPPFDQFKHLVEQLRELPCNRTHFVTPWIPQYQIRGKGNRLRSTIAPGHAWVDLRVLNGRLDVLVFQRSGDVAIGVPSSMIQYAALTLMLEHLAGYPAATYHYIISDAHIYINQIDAVRKMLATEARRLPTVKLTEAGRAVADIHDFKAEHFQLSDYHPNPSISAIPCC